MCAVILVCVCVTLLAMHSAGGLYSLEMCGVGVMDDAISRDVSGVSYDMSGVGEMVGVGMNTGDKKSKLICIVCQHSCYLCYSV